MNAPRSTLHAVRPTPHAPRSPLLPDPATAERLEAHFAKFPDHRLAKYFDWPRHVAEAAGRAKDLGLDIEPRRLETLDLGGGLGYLAYVGRRLGHYATSLDIEHRLSRGSCEILGVPMVGCTLAVEEPLPGSRVYDLVTQYRLNLYRGLDPWGWREYERFARESILPRLAPGGRWHVDPNLDRTGFVLDADRWRRMLGHRAEVYRLGNGVTIEKA